MSEEEIRELLRKSNLSKEESEKFDKVINETVDNLNKNVLKEAEREKRREKYKEEVN